jgi:hypothetical protein
MINFKMYWLDMKMKPILIRKDKQFLKRRSHYKRKQPLFLKSKRSLKMSNQYCSFSGIELLDISCFATATFMFWRRKKIILTSKVWLLWKECSKFIMRKILILDWDLFFIIRRRKLIYSPSLKCFRHKIRKSSFYTWDPNWIN